MKSALKPNRNPLQKSNQKLTIFETIPVNIDEFQKSEMAKTRASVENKLNGMIGWLIYLKYLQIWWSFFIKALQIWWSFFIKATVPKKFQVPLINVSSTKVRQWIKSFQSNNTLKKIRPYLHSVKDNVRKFGEWKIHVTMKINSMSSEDSSTKCQIHSKSDMVKIMKY